MSYMDERRNHKMFGKPPKEKKTYRIPQKSKKKIEEEKAEKLARNGEETDLVKFFKRCMKYMTGRCAETGLKHEYKIYEYAIRAVCHLLPKASCESVKYHPLNWIELNPDFHVKFDAMSWEEREKLGCWPVIKERLIMIWPDLDPSEHRHFPDSVKDYISKNTFYE
jgi:hypothetical protein